MLAPDAHAADLYGAGADAADELLRGVYRIEKALDPLDRRDFTSIVRRLSRALREAEAREATREPQAKIETEVVRVPVEEMRSWFEPPEGTP